MSLAFFVSWKEAVPQKKLERIKNAKKKKVEIRTSMLLLSL